MRITTSLALVAAMTILVVAPREALARCASASLSVWPSPSEPLPANGRISIEGYGTEQDFVRSLRGRHPRLLSGRRSIPLRVVEIQEGAFRITQAILEPESALEPGRRYVLSVDGRSRIGVWADSGRARAAWTAGAADTAGPTWGSAPALRPSTYQRFGCGPAIHGHVGVSISDSGPARIRVRLTPVAGGPEQVYDVSPRDGDLAIGHGMCSGAYELAPGARYRVVLEAIDVAGNRTPAPGGALTIIGPTP